DQTYQLAKKYKVKLAWGTDLLFNPANTKNQNQGILKLRQWFSNFEILKMVTHDNAELLALSGARNPYPGKLGVIEEDAWADLILVDGDVLKDIILLGDPEKNFIMIMKGGEIYKNRV
ncbi:MAG TPA: amidohydrolase family protein, partial [Bacteroides fragilis]|nr:amidohydrolase family protein [Bacteroides fragilis]